MSAKQGYGVILKATIATVPTLFPNITKITAPNGKVNIIDGSSMDSAAQYKEKIVGFKDGGQAKVDYNFDNTNTVHQWVNTNFGTIQHFQIIWPGATAPNKLDFDAIISDGGNPDVPFDNKQTASMTLEVTGVPVWS